MTNDSATGCVYSPIDYPRAGTTPLHLAAIHSPPSTITLLLDASAEVHAVDDYDCVPLTDTVVYGRVDTVCALLEAGANPKVLIGDIHTLFHVAAGWRKGPEMVRTILLTNLNLEVPDEMGNTPLHWACVNTGGKYPCLEVVELLLDAGASVSARGSNQMTPLYGLVDRRAEFLMTELILRMLVERGGDVGALDSRGRTAYQFAFSN